MKRLTPYALCLLIAMFAVTFAQSQTTASTSDPSSVVPSSMKFSGTAKDLNGKPLTGIAGITFSLYQGETGGAALWIETQNVHIDAAGRFNVPLGAEKPLPVELFASGEARWLGVQVEGQAEQPRVLLLSVPYALKAADAETLGGKPASAFLQAAGLDRNGAQPQALPPVVHGNGTVSYVPLWTAKNVIDKSSLFQSGTNLGIGTTTPASALDVNGATSLRNTLTLFPSGSAPTLAVSGTAFNVSTTGLVTFIAGQTFPGAGGGTITGVTAGTDLTGGGTSGNVTLNLNTTATDARYAQLAAVNAFTKNNSFAGTVGIGTTTPGAQLDVEAPVTAGTGIQGVTSSTAFFAAGIFGHATGTSGVTRGVYGASDSPSGIGVHGIAQIGGQFETGTGTIFLGRGQGQNRVTIDSLGNTVTTGSLTAQNGLVASSAGGTGLFASTGGSGTAIAGIASQGLAGLFFNDGPGPALAVQSDALFGSDLLLEGDSVFGGATVPVMLLDVSGDLSIAGSISKSGGSFKIDHPVDPANKYLYHSFVESPDMMNIYNGVVVLDNSGETTITLPDWFEALNRDFRYQLTAMGAPGPNLYVSEEVSSNHFKIAGGKPGSKVSWQVTGVRHDAWADAHRIPVEVEKTGDEAGKYLHPELFGLARDKFGIQSKTTHTHKVAAKQ